MSFKHISYANMQTFAEELKAKYAKKSDVSAVAERVRTLENVGSEANVLEGVKVNGTALEIANKIVDILIATGNNNGNISVNNVDVAVKGLAAMAFKADVSQSDLDAALAAAFAAKAEASSVYTKEQVDAKISAVYKPAGSCAFADLPTPAANLLGNVYNVTNKFTTTDDFVEGANAKHPAGTNVVIVEIPAEEEGEDPTYKFDVLSGFVDLSGYVEIEEGKRLMTDAEGTKLAAIAENATKVEASTTNGNIKINDTETTVYTLPSDVVKTGDFETVTDAEMRALLADEPAGEPNND